MRDFVRRIVVSISLVLALTVVLTQSAPAQTFNVIHTFTGKGDGATPWSGLTMDQAGNLYGTTCGNDCGYGGNAGSIFRLSRNGSSWIFNPLYNFPGGSAGGNPYAGVVLGPHGSLYGTTPYAFGGYGTVFSLTPSATACKSAICYWAETLLYRFTGGSDGAAPAFGDVIFDGAGNLYGTTLFGGAYSAGTVFELTPSGSGWTENILYSFTGGSDGGYPYAGLIFDQAGALYGATMFGGQAGGGTVFKLTPVNGIWNYSTVYSFNGPGGAYCGPAGNLIMDAAANLYGATQCDGTYGLGSVFELTLSGGRWTYTSLHDFANGSDGGNPVGPVMLDASGNLYGTASRSGSSGQGVVFEITP